MTNQLLSAATVYGVEHEYNKDAPDRCVNTNRRLTRSSESTREGLLVESTQYPPIKAIETKYAGCRFRSRLEARWAVFWTHLGIKWEYEPEGYALTSGYYLPDFLLPGLFKQGLWFEVKPETPISPNIDPRWVELTVVTSRPFLIAYGLPRHNDGSQFARRRLGFISAGEPQRMVTTSGKPVTFDTPRHRAAFTAARSARFEHGETG